MIYRNILQYITIYHQVRYWYYNRLGTGYTERAQVWAHVIGLFLVGTSNLG